MNQKKKSLMKILAQKRAKYCSEICGGKCCKVYDENQEIRNTCPKLTECGSCSIYRERYVEKKPFGWFFREGKNVFHVECGQIRDILAANALPKHIADQCCYSDPKLLELVK